MSKIKIVNVADQISQYDDDFIRSISLKDVTSAKSLKQLLTKLETAYKVVTSYYETVYNDYIIMINSEADSCPNCVSIDTLKKYKQLASKIQKAYSYILYMNTFDNPFKSKARK